MFSRRSLRRDPRKAFLEQQQQQQQQQPPRPLHASPELHLDYPNDKSYLYPHAPSTAAEAVVEPVVYLTPTHDLTYENDEDSRSTALSQQELLRRHARESNRIRQRSRNKRRNNSQLSRARMVPNTRQPQDHRTTGLRTPSYSQPMTQPFLSIADRLPYALEERGEDDWWNEFSNTISTPRINKDTTTTATTTTKQHSIQRNKQVRFASQSSHPFDEEGTSTIQFKPSPTSVMMTRNVTSPSILKPSRHTSPRTPEPMERQPFFHETVPSYDSYEQRQETTRSQDEETWNNSRQLFMPNPSNRNIVEQLGHPGEKHEYLRQQEELQRAHRNIYQGNYYPDPDVQVLDDESTTVASLHPPNYAQQPATITATNNTLASEPFLFHVAAIVIQTCWRRYICTLYLEFLREDAALKREASLDSITTSTPYEPGDLLRMEQKLWALAVTRIQAAFRGFWTRDCLIVDQYCAARIQSQWRAYAGQREYQALQQAARLIQVWWRRVLARQRDSQEEDHSVEEVVASIVIQTTWRAYVCEMQFLRSLVDILIVQSVARGWLVRMRERRRRVAAQRIPKNPTRRTNHHANTPTMPWSNSAKQRNIVVTTPPRARTGASVEVDTTDPSDNLLVKLRPHAPSRELPIEATARSTNQKGNTHTIVESEQMKDLPSVFGVKLRKSPGPTRPGIPRSTAQLKNEASSELASPLEPSSPLRSHSSSKLYQDGLLVLISEQSISRRLLNEQSMVINSLKAYNIDFWTVDGADPQNREMREELFTLAGKRGSYPVYFLVKDGKPSYWGNQEAFERANENKELSMRFPVKSSTETARFAMGAARVTSNWEQQKLERELIERRRLQKIVALDEDPTLLDNSFELQQKAGRLLDPPTLHRKPMQSQSHLHQRPDSPPAQTTTPNSQWDQDPQEAGTIELCEDVTAASLPSDEGRTRSPSVESSPPCSPALHPEKSTAISVLPEYQIRATFLDDESGANSILADSSNPSTKSTGSALSRSYISTDDASSQSNSVETKLVGVIDVTDLISQASAPLGDVIVSDTDEGVRDPSSAPEEVMGDGLYSLLDHADDCTVDTKEAATAQQAKNVETLLKAFGSFDQKDVYKTKEEQVGNEIIYPEINTGAPDQRTMNLIKLLHAMEVDQELDKRIADSKVIVSHNQESDNTSSAPNISEEKKFDTLYKAVNIAHQNQHEEFYNDEDGDLDASLHSQGTEGKAQSLLSSWNK